uniref:Bloodthirsty-related gene family, member 26 n=1 Tax=Hucho hucho TaxID=62062 RepID=A0A4W5RRW5_9TELE
MAKLGKVFTALVRSIERSQAEIIEVIEEKQKAAEKWAEGLVKELEQEFAELQRRSNELEQLSHTEGHLQLLQSFPSLHSPPPTKDWSEISVHSNLCLGTVRRAVSQLEETLMSEVKRFGDVELEGIQQYAVDVTLDPDTAPPYLILSRDGKQMKNRGKEHDLPNYLERFVYFVNVLGIEGFSSGRFYYEVMVTVCQLEEGYHTKASEWILDFTPQKAGVFMDCEEGQVSFYDVGGWSHIYSFTGCNFTEMLYPYLGPNPNPDGEIFPLIISATSTVSP